MTWHSVIKDYMKMHSNVILTDQDIFNAAVKEDNRTVLVLPCVWNVQLSDNMLSDYCSKSAHDSR